MKGLYGLVLSFALALTLVILLAAGMPVSVPTSSAEGDTATWEVQSDCTQATSSLTRTVYTQDGQIGECATPSGASQPGIPISGSSPQLYIYFDVDPTFMSGNTFAQVDVQYFDGAYSSQGDTLFYIQYQSASAVGTRSDQLFYLNNTQTYVTGTFYLANVNFANELHGGDFRIAFLNPQSGGPFYLRKITVTRFQSSPVPSYAGASTVSYQAPDTPANRQGLYPVYGGDGHTALDSSYGRPAIQVPSDNYAYFDADDSFIYNGSYKYAAVQISYLDQGYGRLYLTYNSDSSLASDPTAAQTFDQELQSDNVAYMTNSRTWKTYTFYLANVKFANRQLLGLADFKVVYSMGTDVATANQGYLLALDRVTLTRSNAALDRTASLVGNYPDFGDPVVVRTRLAQANEEGHGLWQNDSISDGGTTASTQGGQQSRLNSPGGYIYFDVNDAYIKNGNAYDVWVTVQYFDNGTGAFFLEYDATSSASKATEAVARTGTNAWKVYTFYLADAYFGNRQNGGSDFRATSAGKDLYLKTVYVQRAPGNLVRPRTTSLGGFSSFNLTQPKVAAFYFPAFDYYYPSLWPMSSLTPTASLQNGYPVGYSHRSVESIKNDLAEMKAANVDIALLQYFGDTQGATYMGVNGARNLVAAAE